MRLHPLIEVSLAAIAERPGLRHGSRSTRPGLTRPELTRPELTTLGLTELGLTNLGPPEGAFAESRGSGSMRTSARYLRRPEAAANWWGERPVGLGRARLRVDVGAKGMRRQIIASEAQYSFGDAFAGLDKLVKELSNQVRSETSAERVRRSSGFAPICEETNGDLGHPSTQMAVCTNEMPVDSSNCVDRISKTSERRIAMTKLPRRYSQFPSSLLSLIPDVERFWELAPGGEEVGQLYPLDVEERPDAYIVTMNAPGITDPQQQLDVHLEGKQLRINVNVEEEKEEKGKVYLVRERSSRRCTRLIPLAAASNEIAAEYHDGVLHIEVKKATEQRLQKVQIATRR